MMKIALIGTGKMGMAVEEQAIRAGHEILFRINHLNRSNYTVADLKRADIAIEFTQPDAAVDNLLWCLEAGIPVICGTTGWQEMSGEVFQKFIDKKGAIITATNFSIGVNILFRLNRELAAWMNSHTDYHPFIEEVHHTRKLDKPSGTAVTLADGIFQSNQHVKSWMLTQGNPEVPNDVLAIHSVREGDVIGKHEVAWTSHIDKISIHHEAFNREGFAAGALLAASWLIGKIGVFSMEDVLFGNRKSHI